MFHSHRPTAANPYRRRCKRCQKRKVGEATPRGDITKADKYAYVDKMFPDFSVHQLFARLRTLRVSG